MKNIFFALAIATTTSFAAHAQVPSRSSVSELLTLTQSEALVNDANKIIQALVDQNISQSLASKSQPLNSAQKQAIDKFTTQLSQLLSDALKWNTLEDQFIAIYSKIYSQQEINDLIAFYKTPTGQSSIKKMPLLMQQSVQITQNTLNPLLPQIQAISAAFQAEFALASKNQ